MLSVLYFVVALFAFKDLVYLMQLEDYSVVRLIRKLGLKTKMLHEILIILLGVILYILSLKFDYQTTHIIFFLIILFVNTIKTYIQNKNNSINKIELKFTKRIIRMCFMFVTIYILTQTLLLVCNFHMNYYFFNLYILIMFMFSYFLILPIERFVYIYYLNKAIKKLQKFKDLKVVAITGSFGKTSTKNILYEMLSGKYNVLKSPASYNTPMGISKTILEHLKPYHQILILEFGAKKKGEIKYLCKKFSPGYGILTSIGKQHLETFGSFENVVKTKVELQDNLSSPRFMVFNCDNQNVSDACVDYVGDCARTHSLIDHDGRISCVKISNDVVRNYYVKDMTVDVNGSVFNICNSAGRSGFVFKCKLLGRHNVSNIVCAYAMARHLNVTNEEIFEALNRLEYTPHRLEKKVFENKIIIDNSYNSNPDSFLCALETLGMFKQHKKVLITPGVVEQGRYSYDENYKLGRAAASVADEVLIVNATNRRALKNGLIDAGFSEESIKLYENFSDINFGEFVNGEVVLIENDLPDNYK